MEVIISRAPKEHDQPWVFALGAESLSSHSGKQRVRVITFNKTYGNNIKSFYALNGLAGEISEIELEPGYLGARVQVIVTQRILQTSRV